MPVTLRLLAAALAAASISGGGIGASPPDPACASPPYRAFDFWLGEWVVRDSAGQDIGRNRIRRVAGGCGLLESWTSARGSTGTSLNYYDPKTGRWTQVWVGESGVRLRLEGGKRGDSMVLEGTRTRGDTTLHDRITWTPRDDGSVEQRWEISTDGGRSWEVPWRGFYDPSARDVEIGHSLSRWAESDS